MWNRKDLHLLTKEDMMKAANWVRVQSKGRQFAHMMALRYLVRGPGGFGNKDWLTDFMRTKKLKVEARLPPEFLTEESFVKVQPAITRGMQQLLNEGKISLDEWETESMLLHLKRRLGPRTGNKKTEKEVWGTKINAGLTNLILDGNGKVLVYDVWAKKDERWKIPANLWPTELKEEVERYVAKRGLKNGDFLIQKMTEDRANAILKMACAAGGIQTPLELHDMRKWFATSGVLAEVPMQDLADFGVGWKNLQTMKEFYVMIKGVKSEKTLATIQTFLAKQSGQVISTN
jgi:hypothetical protein